MKTINKENLEKKIVFKNNWNKYILLMLITYSSLKFMFLVGFEFKKSSNFYVAFFN